MKTLEDKHGNPSSIRSGMLLCVATGCAVALMGVYLDRDMVGLGVLVAGLIAPITACKAYQKGSE